MMVKLKSRKFWAAVVGSLSPIITQVITGAVGWETALTLSAGVLASYIFGQGYTDAHAKK
jgi:hypothetical protein